MADLRVPLRAGAHRPRAGCHLRAHIAPKSARHPCRSPARWSRLWWHTRQGKRHRSCEWTWAPLLHLHVGGWLPQAITAIRRTRFPLHCLIDIEYILHESLSSCDYPLARSLSASRITSFSPCAAVPDFSIFFSVSFTSWKPIPEIHKGRQRIFIERIAVRAIFRFGCSPTGCSRATLSFNSKRDSRRGLSCRYRRPFPVSLCHPPEWLRRGRGPTA